MGSENLAPMVVGCLAKTDSLTKPPLEFGCHNRTVVHSESDIVLLCLGRRVLMLVGGRGTTLPMGRCRQRKGYIPNDNK